MCSRSVGIDNAGVEASDQSGGCGWIDGFAIRVDPGDVVIGCEGDRDGVGGVDVVEEDGAGVAQVLSGGIDEF